MIPVQFHPDPTPPGGDPPFGHRPDAAHPAKHPADNQPPNRLNILLSFAGWQPDPWVERLPRLLEPLGVASHVAGSGKHAQQVIRTVPIHIAVVDLALPLDDRCDDAPEFAEAARASSNSSPALTRRPRWSPSSGLAPPATTAATSPAPSASAPSPWWTGRAATKT